MSDRFYEGLAAESACMLVALRYEGDWNDASDLSDSHLHTYLVGARLPFTKLRTHAVQNRDCAVHLTPVVYRFLPVWLLYVCIFLTIFEEG